MVAIVGAKFNSGNLAIRQMDFPEAGDVVNGHAHNFDHNTYFPRGAALVEQLRQVVPAVYDTDGLEVEPAKYVTVRAVEKRASDPQNWVLIKAGVIHRITAREAGTRGHCLFPHRNAQGEIVEEDDGWTPGTL